MDIFLNIWHCFLHIVGYVCPHSHPLLGHTSLRLRVCYSDLRKSRTFLRRIGEDFQGPKLLLKLCLCPHYLSGL